MQPIFILSLAILKTLRQALNPCYLCLPHTNGYLVEWERLGYQKGLTTSHINIQLGPFASKMAMRVLLYYYVPCHSCSATPSERRPKYTKIIRLWKQKEYSGFNNDLDTEIVYKQYIIFSYLYW